MANTTSMYAPGSAWSSASSRFTAPQQLYPNDPSCQPCPDCGGLECYCRPRFFAGQLLSEQDLNRLDAYIKGKNQLHNRYLWGAGVVCGLEVRCHPCGDAVSVSPGYALSPCGDDIVVCKADVVDVCSLINKCRTTTMPNCQNYSGDTSGCQDLIENWILAIRYEEKPSRGITALTGASQNCCACGKTNCTSVSVGGCGCAGMQQAGCGGSMPTATQTATTQTTTRSTPPPPACEPTLTCETYRYEVYRAPDPQKQPIWGRTSLGLAGFLSVMNGELPERFICCVQNLLATVPPMPSGTSYNQAWYQWLCATKQAAINYFMQYGGYDCQAVYQLQALVFPDPNSRPPPSQQDVLNAFLPLAAIFFEEIAGCFCSSALPPCPDPGDPRVALAMVSVRSSDCTIVAVCDWTPSRKHVLTFPNLAYWWGWVPYTGLIRQIMNAFCCDFLGLLDLALGQPQAQSGTGGTVAGEATREDSRPANAGTSADSTGSSDPMSRPISLNVGNYAPNSPAGNVALALINNLQKQPSTLTVGDFIQSLFQPVNVGTGALATQQREVEDLAGTPAMRTLTEILRPLTASIPPGLLQAIAGAPPATNAAAPAAPPSGAASATPVPAADVPAPAAAADVDELRTRLTQLQQTVVEQQSQIDALKNSPPPSGRRR